MFKRQKPETSPLRRPEAASGSVLATAEPVAHRSAAVMPMAGSLPRPATNPLPPKPLVPGVGAMPEPHPLSPVRPAAAITDMSARRDTTQRRTLVVGRGISVQGTVQDAERLVVEGTVEASMVHAAELVVAAGGMFKGGAEIQDAEIAGTIDGSLTVRGSLIVRATGKVLGTAHCHRLQVEEGGQINGQVEMLAEPVRSEKARDVLEAAE